METTSRTTGRAPLSIGQLAKRSGTAADTLRYYERLGILTPADRSAAGYRRYNESALERLAFVRRAQLLGLTLDAIREIVTLADRGEAPCGHVQAALAQRLQEVDARIDELRALRRTLGDLLAAATPTRTSRSPDGCVCGIIESIDAPAGKAQPIRPVRRSRPAHRQRSR